MKYIRYTYCLKAMAVSLLLISFVSCLRDETYIDEEKKGLIIMSLSNSQTRAGELFEGDKQINKVRIFVFINNSLEINQLFSSNLANPFVLTVATGFKDVYVVANENDALTASLAAVTSKTALKALLSNEIGAELPIPFVMAGEVHNVEVVETPTGEQNKANITLTRVAAKINLTFKKETTAEVKITKVSLLQNTKKTMIYEEPLPSTETQGYWNFQKTYSTPQLLTDNTMELKLDPVYVYENLAGSGNKDKATLLEVEALYNNTPTKYRVYVNENVSAGVVPGDPASSVTNPSDHLYQVKRNYEYRLTGTIKGMGEVDGLLLQVKVMPWDLVQTEQVLKDDDVEIDSSLEYQAGGLFTTSKTAPLTFTFKLTKGPEGATWEATIDNGLEFAFANIDNSKGVLGEEKTIVIKPLKDFNSTIERSTHFYITVTNPANGTKQKIPLFDGHSDTQILIKQVM